MLQDYRQLTVDQLEALEKQTLRTVVQALQEYSREAKDIFDNTPAPTENEVIVLAEDLLQYALEVAEAYPINKRFAGFIDYKRVRWISTPFGLLPQVLLVDAKASTENNRTTLQQSQLSMTADFQSRGQDYQLLPGVAPHLSITSHLGNELPAITTSIFIHYYYNKLANNQPPFRLLKSIYVIGLPHQNLKFRYNPNAAMTFFGQGKHSPARQEVPRIRVYFSRLRDMCPWRLQELNYFDGELYTKPLWRDVTQMDDGRIQVVMHLFEFIGR